VSLLRHSIPGLMTLVLLAALDCTAVRTPLSGRSVTDVMLLLGALPMANVLVVGLLPLLHGRAGRGQGGLERIPGLIGFEAVGSAALLGYTVAAFKHADLLRDVVANALASLRPLGNPTFLSAVVATLLLPQLALALLGGWAVKRHGIGVTRPGG
jgi:hypothetical protein